MVDMKEKGNKIILYECVVRLFVYFRIIYYWIKQTLHSSSFAIQFVFTRNTTSLMKRLLLILHNDCQVVFLFHLGDGSIVNTAAETQKA